MLEANDLAASLNKKNIIHILHVDDDSSIREISKQILLEMGNFEIDNACCVDEAFKKLSTGHYDVVVSDYEMPQKNGLEFLKELREAKNEIPFILFTGKGREEVAIKALNLGADGYHNKQGTPETVYGELTHIIVSSFEKRNTQKMFWESEERFKKLVTNSQDAIMLTRADGIILYLSPACKNVLGYEPNELIGKVPWIIHPDDLEKVQKVFQSALTSKVSETLEYRILTKQGETKWVNHAFSQIWENDKLKQIVSNLTDITELKKGEEVVKKSEVRYRELANFLPEVVFETDLTGKITFFSQTSFELTGYTSEELDKGMNMLQFVVPEDRERAKENIRKRMAGQKSGNSEYMLFRKNGDTYPAIVKTAPIFSDNKLRGLRGLVIDITERREAEELLRESEKKYRTLIEQSTQGLLLGQGPKPHIIFANSTMAKIMGYSVQELSSLSLQQVLGLVHPDDREFFFERFKKRLEGKLTPVQYEFRGIKKDGSTVWLELSSTLIEYQGQPTLQAVFADISERKQAEEKLKESEERSRAIIANSPIGIATSGIDKQFLSANEAFCKILGYTEKELRKLTFKNITHPADFKESALKMEELENGKISSFTLEKRYIKKDGSVVDGKVMVSKVSNQNGKPALFVAELEDITERKKTEDQRKVLEKKVNDYSKYLKYMVDLRTTQLKDSNERLVKAERLAAIGELAGMVGHDLRNPLAGIKNAVYFLKKKGTTIKEEQSKEMLEVIDKAIEHSDKIINDLLEYARDMHLELADSALPTLLDAALRMIQVPDRIQILNHVNKEILINVDADKIMRIFMNLIKNAIDAIPEKGTIEISSCKIRDCIEVAFSDTGTGIPKETLSKIFTPLFTTKAQGMGFGLAICKRIIEAHGGTIKVKTVLDKGTTFTISLPTKPKVPSSENLTVLVK